MKKWSLASCALLLFVLLPAPSLYAAAQAGNGTITVVVTQGLWLWNGLAKNGCSGFWSGKLMREEQPHRTFGTILPGTPFTISASECHTQPNAHYLAMYREELKQELARRNGNASPQLADQISILKGRVNSLTDALQAKISENAGLQTKLAAAQSEIAILQRQRETRSNADNAWPASAWWTVGILIVIMILGGYLLVIKYKHAHGMLLTSEAEKRGLRNTLSERGIPETVRISDKHGRKHVFQLDHPYFENGVRKEISWCCPALHIYGVKTKGYIGDDLIPLREAVDKAIEEYEAATPSVLSNKDRIFPPTSSNPRDQAT